MLKTNEMKDYIFGVAAKSMDEPFVVGNGVLTSTHIRFNKQKTEEHKAEVASFLQEIGVDNYPLISLERLTTLRNGEVWNPLQTVEDFAALDLFLALSNACGFIMNNEMIIQMNIATIGDLTSIAISSMGREMAGSDEKWLSDIRNRIVNRMFFLVDQESLRKCESSIQEPIEPSHNPVPIMEFGARRPEDSKND